MEKVLLKYNQTLRLKGYSENTIRSYKAMFKKFLKEFKGEALEEITTDQIRKYLYRMIDIRSKSSYPSLIAN